MLGLLGSSGLQTSILQTSTFESENRSRGQPQQPVLAVPIAKNLSPARENPCPAGLEVDIELQMNSLRRRILANFGS